MEPTELEGLLETREKECKGVDEDNKPVFSKGTEEIVIIKIYKDGRTYPLCRYLLDDIKCNPTLVNTESVTDKSKLGYCLYHTS